jgi:hypothetical protein
LFVDDGLTLSSYAAACISPRYVEYLPSWHGLLVAWLLAKTLPMLSIGTELYVWVILVTYAVNRLYSVRNRHTCGFGCGANEDPLEACYAVSEPRKPQVQDMNAYFNHDPRKMKKSSNLGGD